MVMIVNFWVYAAPSMLEELEGAARIGSPPFGTLGRPASVVALTYPKLNTLDERTYETFRNFGERGLGLFPPGLLNCYARGEDIHDFLPIRAELQALENYYYPDFWVGGAWDYGTGDVIGGVGSPWFTYPGALLSIMPGGTLSDIALLAGQTKRKFL